MTIRLLLADADPASARMVQASLVRHGFEVTAVADGQRAVEEFQPRRFDVVLVDTTLPRKDGFAVANDIRTKPGGNQVGLVLMSAGAPPPDVDQQLKRAQADAWMDKPLSLKKLRVKLGELAEKYTGATLPAPAERSRSNRPAPGPAPAARPAPKPAPKPAPARPPPPPVVVQTPSPPPPAAPQPMAAGFDPPPNTSVFPAPRALDLPSAAPRRFHSATESARVLIELAREKVTGMYMLKHREAEAKVAFMKGIMVGASDNAPENRLLTRLVRRGSLRLEDIPEIRAWSHEHQMRVGEAVMAMDLCDAETLLDELQQQAADRIVLAAGWTEGEMAFVETRDDVERIAIGSFDAYEGVLRRFEAYRDIERVRGWIEAHGNEAVTTSKDFETGLVAYARLAPTSPLPGILFGRPPNLNAICSGISVIPGTDQSQLFTHVYGMWVVGLLRLDSDGPPGEHRPVPKPVRTEEVERVVPDKEAVSAIRAEWLRAQGRSYYDVLAVSPEAPEEEIWEAIASYSQRFGQDALADKKLGPAEGLAAELWALLEDMQATLSDSEMRATYDELQREASRSESLDNIDAESHFLEGKLALAGGDLVAAKEGFEAAVAYDSENLEYRSHLSWVYFLEGAALVDGAMGALRAAAHANPSDMRPMLLLGQAQERLGGLADAKASLEEALRRCPDDPEVQRALRRVEDALHKKLNPSF
jgi:CheY-like chemotaxis protein